MIWREHRQNAAASPPPKPSIFVRHDLHGAINSIPPLPSRLRLHSPPPLYASEKPLGYLASIPAKAPARMEAALKASIALPQLPAAKTLGAAGRGAPTPRGARILSQRRRRSNPARFCMCRAILGTQRSGRTRGRSYRRSWMGGIASSSWPPAAASPSGTVGLPRLFFLCVFYCDEMAVRRLLPYVFI